MTRPRPRPGTPQEPQFHLFRTFPPIDQDPHLVLIRHSLFPRFSKPLTYKRIVPRLIFYRFNTDINNTWYVWCFSQPSNAKHYRTNGFWIAPGLSVDQSGAAAHHSCRGVLGLYGVLHHHLPGFQVLCTAICQLRSKVHFNVQSISQSYIFV